MSNDLVGFIQVLGSPSDCREGLALFSQGLIGKGSHLQMAFDLLIKFIYMLFLVLPECPRSPCQEIDGSEFGFKQLTCVGRNMHSNELYFRDTDSKMFESISVSLIF